MRNSALFNAIVLASGKILKKSILIVSIGLFYLGVMANAPLATKQQIEMFKNTKTCVVFEDGISFYNAFIKDAIQKYWKSTSYEFIDQTEFEKRKTDIKYSFIVLIDENYDKDPAGVSYHYINLVLGSTSDNITMMPEYCSIPISYSGDKGTDYQYVIPAIVKFMQIHVKNLEKYRFPISLNGLKYYNKSGFKDRVLIFDKDKMAPDADSPEKIKAGYPYNFKLLNIDEIEKEFIASPANTLFHFHVGPPKDAGAGKCFEMFFDVDGNLYYYNFRKVTNDNPDGFNLKDFNDIK
jgi:hypothetical protein